MKGYCVRERKQTDSFPGSECVINTKNNRYILQLQSQSCKGMKSRFISAEKGSGLE